MAKAIEVGSEVLVPRTGGGRSPGKVIGINGNRVTVSLLIGKMYQGETSPYAADATATKTVNIDQLTLL